MYRDWLEEILGFKLRAAVLILDPVTPLSWPGFKLRFRNGATIDDNEFEIPDSVGKGVSWVERNGRKL